MGKLKKRRLGMTKKRARELSWAALGVLSTFHPDSCMVTHGVSVCPSVCVLSARAFLPVLIWIPAAPFQCHRLELSGRSCMIVDPYMFMSQLLQWLKARVQPQAAQLLRTLEFLAQTKCTERRRIRTECLEQNIGHCLSSVLSLSGPSFGLRAAQQAA